MLVAFVATHTWPLQAELAEMGVADDVLNKRSDSSHAHRGAISRHKILTSGWRPVTLTSRYRSTLRCFGFDLSQRMEEKWRHMATLKIKNLPDTLYKKLQARAKREGRSLAQEVTHLLAEALETSKSLSILELRGLGKELWQGVDAAAHVRRERDSWD